MFRSSKLLVMFILCGTSISAQFNVGVQAAYMQTFSSSSIGHPGFGLRGEVGLTEEVAIQGGFHYFFSGEYPQVITVTAKSLLEVPQTIDVQTSSVIDFLDFYIGAKYYMVGSYFTMKKKSGVGVYVAGHIGVMTAGFQTLADSTNNVLWEKYKEPIKDRQLGAFTFLSLNPAIGMERMFGPVYLYAELGVSVKLYETSSAGTEFKMPFVTKLDLGIRVPFGGDY